ncbi:enoyl-CoA hydratase/isomerase family protein [Hydrocarboniphaga sp.]|uniref:enoyl-CoA hydratase/isomerase family protein n=1 Tax=Hydrocarboniphaga sp. TaxID=2033016 RepID=UPI003D0CB31E
MSSAELRLPETESIALSLDDGVLHLRLNRPEARNAMNPQMLAEIGAVFDAVRDRLDVRVVVLRGAGGHFCAGADLKSLGSGAKTPGDRDPVATLNRRFGTMLQQVEAASQVVIAVCEGAVLGGGFGLACVADITLAQAQARFGLPETTRGLPPAQIAPFVAARIGLSQARRLCLSGAQFDGIEARRLGLAHECYDDSAALDAGVAATIAAVLRCAPQANAITKAILMNAGRHDLDARLDAAAVQFSECTRGAEAAEGISAFMQKRAARWASPHEAG